MMKHIVRKALYTLGISLTLIVMIPLAYGTYLYYKADFKCPHIKIDLKKYPMTIHRDSLRVIENNYLLLNRYGLWEAYVTGNAIDRGTKLGIMEKDLLHYQEAVFVEQIKQIVPSDRYLNFLHKLTAIFNWNMANYIPEEYREEIYAISQSCSHEFDLFGTPYERQLNYHAAHDIGHTMQEYMLVGCTSFATWGMASADSTLLVGRNFDFYVGDQFAKNKIVLFVSPQKGYKYASITWPGMIGVLSGMNEHGLTVTINAAKGKIPTSSAMPISILARTILQYADNIETAYRIAKSHQTFVSESILIGSKKDCSAAIIEKTPKQTALYRSKDNKLLCTNHFQSDVYSTDKYNLENIKLSDSQYRYKRLEQLISKFYPITPPKAAAILRDYRGMDDKEIGFTNQKSINQAIAHHSVIFQPEKLKMWISTEPWQAGPYICYDLNTVFHRTGKQTQSMIKKDEIILADTAFLSKHYLQIKNYREQYKILKQHIVDKQMLPQHFIGSFLKINPEYYETYNITGDYMHMIGDKESAKRYWSLSLEKEISTLPEKNNIEEKIKEND